MLVKKNFLLLMFLILHSINAHANQVWFCPINTDFIDNNNHVKEWPIASKKIKVIKFYHGLIYNTDVSILKNRFDILHDLGIKIAIELPIMIDPYPDNKKYIEGFEGSNYVKKIISKLKNNNISVDFFVMDEPLYFGAYRGENKSLGAKVAVESVVEKSISNIELIKKNYPNAELGLVEPIQLFMNDDFYNYFKLYNDEMKLRKVDIKFIQDDIVWNKFDKGVVLSLSNRLKVNNISFDVIINSSVKANTNSQWIDSANGNLRLIFDLIKKNQIGVVFQSWNKYPDKIIPEWSPNSHLSQVVFFEKLMQLNSNGTQK